MFINVILFLLVLAGFASGYRIVAGPSVWDRLLGLSLMSSKMIIIMILYSYEKNHSYYLDVALVFALLGFVGTTSISKFLQKNK